MRVSVIIPFLNEEDYLDEAIRSVLRQKYSDWELLLVDDGSTDGSTAIAKNYASKFPGRITYCGHPGHANRGLSASRNEGIRRSSGELIALLDADDVWLPGKLAHQTSLFDRHPGIGMALEGSIYWSRWDENGIGENRKVGIGAPQDRVFLPGELSRILYPLGRGAAPCPCAVMLRRVAFDRSGGFEESFVGEAGLYEDQAFLSKVYLNERVYVSSSCRNLYRQRTGSIVWRVRASGGYHRVRRRFLEWMKAYLAANEIDDEEVGALVEKALLPYRKPWTHFVRQRLASPVRRILSGRGSHGSKHLKVKCKR